MSILEKIKNITWNEKIKVLRILNGWTQAVAAEKCCTQNKVYWLWETAKTYPRKNSQKAIARAFDVSVGEIFGDDVKNNESI